MAWTTAVTRATGYGVTATTWNTEHVDNMNFLKEVGYTSYTADVACTATTVGTANQIISSGAITYENVPHLIEFYCPRRVGASVSNFLIIRDSTTVLGTLARFGGSENMGGLYTMYRITPTAASHTYNVAAWNASAGTTTYEAGTGGTAGDASTDVAGFIRISRVPT